MSLADLSSKLYTIKSRKNVPFATAFTQMIREDLAMRYSVFNLVKSLSGSELIAQVAEAKYGFRTPLQRGEEAREKKRASMDRKFKLFTADSIVTLNNKINTLASITERNSILIENLYHDLGSFRTQRKFAKRDLSTVATKIPIKSRTVKFQIENIRSELDALQKITVGPKTIRKIKNSAAAGGVMGAAVMTRDRDKEGIPEETPTSPEESKSSLLDTAIDLVTGYTVVKGAKDIFSGTKDFIKNKMGKPTATPTEILDKNGKPLRGAALKSAQEKAARETAQKAAQQTPSKTGVMSRLGGAGTLLRSTVIGAAAYELGPGMINRMIGAFQRKGDETRSAAEKIAQIYGMKLIRGDGGTTVAFEIDGKRYTYDELPPQYKNIVNAYLTGDQRSVPARTALAEINKNQETYKLLKTAEGRAQVLAPPMTETEAAIATSSAASAIVAAAKTAKVTTPEPQMIAAGTPEVTAPAALSTANLGTLPSASYTPGQPVDKETVKQIIVQAAGIVGVDPGIMLAMGQQESSFNPNARPYVKDKKTGEMKLLSSAKGLFQFIDSTWKNMLEKYSGKYPELLNGPMDPIANALAGALYVKENSEILRSKKIAITGTSIYATHFLGPGGASKLFSASPTASAVSVLPAAAASNPHIFYANYGKGDARPRTIREVIDTLYKKVGSKAEAYTAEIRRGGIQPLPTTTPGMAVSAPPPPMLSAATAAPSASSAELTAATAVAGNKLTQETVVAVADKVSELDKRTSVDRSFPSVRNSSMLNRGATV